MNSTLKMAQGRTRRKRRGTKSGNSREEPQNAKDAEMGTDEKDKSQQSKPHLKGLIKELSVALQKENSLSREFIVCLRHVRLVKTDGSLDTYFGSELCTGTSSPLQSRPISREGTMEDVEEEEYSAVKQVSEVDDCALVIIEPVPDANERSRLEKMERLPVCEKADNEVEATSSPFSKVDEPEREAGESGGTPGLATLTEESAACCEQEGVKRAILVEEGRENKHRRGESRPETVAKKPKKKKTTEQKTTFVTKLPVLPPIASSKRVRKGAASKRKMQSKLEESSIGVRLLILSEKEILHRCSTTNIGKVMAASLAYQTLLICF